ncbi:MAG: hypothetical protein ACNYVW_09470 [Methanosarcinales archaeon]
MMNVPPYVEQKFKAAETIDNLKAVIVEILDEYNFGILSPLERRIEELEDKTIKKRGWRRK